jgi:hypothetical protein
MFKCSFYLMILKVPLTKYCVWGRFGIAGLEEGSPHEPRGLYQHRHDPTSEHCSVEFLSIESLAFPGASGVGGLGEWVGWVGGLGCLGGLDGLGVMG